MYGMLKKIEFDIGEIDIMNKVVNNFPSIIWEHFVYKEQITISDVQPHD